MNKKISIITVCFNSVETIEDTIQSVLSQTYKNFEYIIIDGGSNDGTIDIILNYKDYISKFISEKDNGIYNAMNKGIKAAKGEFVIFMNGGDCFASTTILKDISTDLNSDYDIYYGDNNKISPNSKRLKTYPEKLTFSFFYSSSINHQSTLIRRSLFETYFYYNEKDIQIVLIC